MTYAYALILIYATHYEILWTYPDLRSCLHMAKKLDGVCLEVNQLNKLNHKGN